MRRKTANFPTGKTFGTWRPDQSSIPEATQNALLTLEWIARAENLVAAGPSGTGKSHFVEALAHAASDKDLRVAWFTLETLTATVGRAKLDGSTARTIARICRCDLVVVDDVGMLPLAKTAPKRSTASSTPPTNAARSRSPATSNSFSKRVRRVDSVPERAKALSCLGLRLQRSPAKKAFVVKRIPRDRCRRNAARRRRRVAARHRLAGRWAEQREPMLTSGKITYEVGGNVEVTPYGGVAAMHRLVTRLGLVEAINAELTLLKIHLPYHESDHVLNMAYNVLTGGTRLEDIERLRHDVAHMNAVGADLIPDPTTAGDFCRRFAEDDVIALMDAVSSVRPQLWRGRGRNLLGPVAYIDVDGTIVPTTGAYKQGMDISYKGIWGYAPLLVTLANTREVLFLVNRPGNAPSHQDAAGWIDKAIDLVTPYAPRVCVRGTPTSP
jgi:hypothetical protein